MIAVRKLKRESASFIVPHCAWASSCFVSSEPAAVRHSHWSGKESIIYANMVAVWVSAALRSAKMVWGLFTWWGSVGESETVVALKSCVVSWGVEGLWRARVRCVLLGRVGGISGRCCEGHVVTLGWSKVWVAGSVSGGGLGVCESVGAMRAPLSSGAYGLGCTIIFCLSWSSSSFGGR